MIFSASCMALNCETMLQNDRSLTSYARSACNSTEKNVIKRLLIQWSKQKLMLTVFNF